MITSGRSRVAFGGALSYAGAVLAGLLSSAQAFAQDAQDAAADRAQSFRAVQGAVQEDVAGGPLLVTAYAVVWVLLLLFVVRLVRQQQSTARDLERLERQLAAHPAQPPA